MTVPKALFCAKIDFGPKLSREETQERATDVGPVMKEKKREREREREKEVKEDQRREVSAPM